jgi:hypothetical protein
VQAALRATAGTASGPASGPASDAGTGSTRRHGTKPLVLDLVALEDEVDVRSRSAR